jgi:hypothetical protein
MNRTIHAIANGAGAGYTDLLGLGREELVISAMQVRIDAPEDSQFALGAVSLLGDEPMVVEMRDAEEPTFSQDHSNRTNRFGQQEARARSNHDFYKTAPRRIRAHRSRRNRCQTSDQHQQGDYCTPRYSLYRDLDNARGRAYHFERQHREPSPETLHNRAEATFVSAMADLDVKEEPREDRRDGDRYRGGGNNKRRREGKLATPQAKALHDTDIRR